MEIYFNNIEGHTFILQNRNNKIIVDKGTPCIQIDSLDSDKLLIELDVSKEMYDLKNWKEKVSLKEKCAVIFTLLCIFLYDALCMSIKTLADMVTPLQETYYLQISENISKYKLVYHKGEFEIITHKYCYPYMNIQNGERLKCEFSMSLQNIEISFWCAKWYYFFLIIPIALIAAIGAGVIWHSYEMMIASVIISSIIYLVSMNLYLNKRKRDLVSQLKKEL